MFRLSLASPVPVSTTVWVVLSSWLDLAGEETVKFPPKLETMSAICKLMELWILSLQHWLEKLFLFCSPFPVIFWMTQHTKAFSVRLLHLDQTALISRLTCECFQVCIFQVLAMQLRKGWTSVNQETVQSRPQNGPSDLLWGDLGLSCLFPFNHNRYIMFSPMPRYKTSNHTCTCLFEISIYLKTAKLFY